MTSKLSWVLFAPMTVVALAAKVIQAFFLTEDAPTFMGLDSLMLTYLVVGCAVVTFAFAILFCAIDRKVAPVYKLSSNYFAGVFGVFLATSLACDGANRAFALFSSMNFQALDIIDVVLTICSAVVFVVLGLNHFVGNGGVKGLAVFYLIPAVWSAFRLVICFMQFTTVSIAVTDITNLVAYIFLTLFLFNYATIVALMKGKSPVKSTFIYGMPAAIMLLSFGFMSIANAITSQVPFDLFENLEGIEVALLGLYIFAFIIELTSFVKRKDEITILDEEDIEYDSINEEERIVNVVSPINDNQRIVPQQIPSNGNNPESEDDENMLFFIEDTNPTDETVDYSKPEDAEGFIYSVVDSEDNSSQEEVPPVMDSVANEGADKYITKADSTYDSEEDDDEVEDEWMDHIDRLILEISEDEFN